MTIITVELTVVNLKKGHGKSHGKWQTVEVTDMRFKVGGTYMKQCVK